MRLWSLCRGGKYFFQARCGLHRQLACTLVSWLDHLELHEEAEAVRTAVAWTLNAQFVTRDIDPVNYYFTSTVGDLVSDFIAEKIPTDINYQNMELGKSTLI